MFYLVKISNVYPLRHIKYKFKLFETEQEAQDFIHHINETYLFICAEENIVKMNLLLVESVKR